MPELTAEEMQKFIGSRKQPDKQYFLDLLDEDKQRAYEELRVRVVMALLKVLYINKLKGKIKEAREEVAALRKEGSDAESYRSVIEANARIRAWRAEIEGYKCFFTEPYFARMDLLDDKEGYNSYYIGKRGDINLEIVDWRAPLARKYYQKSQILFSINQYNYKQILRRALRTENGRFLDYKNEYLNLRDFLTKEEIAKLDICNLNADQLLCARERENCETPYRPYFTLSKADGRVDTLTSIELPRFIASNRTVLSNDGRSYNAHAFLPLLVGCADRMWLTALALDTIFQINPDRSLLPVMAPLRAPTRDEEAPLLHFRGINDRYVWLSCVRRNVTVQLEHMEAGMREDLKIYMYDRKAQTWCEPAYRCRAWSGFEPRYIFTDPLPYGYGLVMLNAMDLVEAYQNDELADERLRQIASTLREDDNPVLMRLKFK